VLASRRRPADAGTPTPVRRPQPDQELENQVVTPLAQYLLEHPDIREAEIQMDLDGQGRVVFH
jgi:hypothetical protein